MSSQLSTSLSTLKKDVLEALNFDRQEKNEDAYKKYLECVLRVSSSLLKNLYAGGGHVLVTKDIEKMVRLGQQCMDRVAGIVSEKLEKAPKQKQSYEAPDSLHISTGTVPPKLGFKTTPTTPASRDTTPTQQTVASLGISMTQYGLSSQKLADLGSVSFGDFSSKPTPMMIAARQNQQLLVALRKRQAQTKNKTASVSLGLTIQRKMAENMAIARAQEAALAKKIKERQERLEEQAAKRFLTPVGLSEEEQEQRQVYKRVLEFEQENDWMMDIRKRFEESPADINIIGELITAVLRCSAHPLTKELQKHLDIILDKITLVVDGKINQIEAIKVPLTKEILDKSSFNLCKTIHLGYKSGIKFSQSESNLPTVKEDEATVLKYSHDTTDQSKTMLESNAGDLTCSVTGADTSSSKSDVSAVSEQLSDDRKLLSQVTEEIKSDLEKAMLEGNKLALSLEKSRKFNVDYETYNQENMDDLFDDVEDEDVDDIQEETKDSSQIENEKELDKICHEQKMDSEGFDEESAKCDDKNQSKTDNIGADNSVLKGDKPKVLKKNPSFTDLETKIGELRNDDYYFHLKGIADDILTSIEKIHVLFVIVFEQLDSAEGRDQCNVLIEGYFFKPLWRNLLVLFRLANEPKELAIASIMTQHQTSTPEDFNVREILCLGTYPYQSAVRDLVAVTQCETMLEKLDFLVRSSKQVMQCVEEFYKQTDVEAPSLGADDLLPILCYVVVKSGLPQLVSECQAMERFIHEGYMFGEEGYCLTSFQTAINYLISEGLSSPTA